MRSVSQLSRASCEGLVPRSPTQPVVKGLSSETAAFPRSAFTIGAASRSAASSSRSPAPERTLPGENRDLPPLVQDLGGPASDPAPPAAARSGPGRRRCGEGRFASSPFAPPADPADPPGKVRWATVRRLMAMRHARSATFSTWLGPITRTLYAATSAKTLSTSTSC